MDIFDLQAKISLDVQQYIDGLNGAEKKTSNFGSKVKSGLSTAMKVGAAVIGAATVAAGALTKTIISGTKEVANYGDEVDKMSQKLGLSASAYQEWDYVLGQAGVEITSMSTGLKTLTNKIDDAKNGSEDAAAMFEKLGISLDDLSTMSREDIFAATISGFQGMADSTERAALANDLFGKSGQELTPLFNETTEKTQELRDAAHDLGFVLSDETVKASAAYKDSLDTLQRTMGGVKNDLSQQFLPALTSVMDGMTQIFGGNEDEGIGLVQAGLDDFVSKLSETIPKVLEFGSEIVLALSTALIEKADVLVEAGFNLMVSLVSGLTKNLSKLTRAAIRIVKTLAKSVSKNFGPLLNAFIDGILEIAKEITSPDTLDSLIDAGIEMVLSLIDGINEAIPRLIQAVPEIIVNLVDAISRNLSKVLSAGNDILFSIIDGIIAAIPELAKAIPQIITSLTSGLASSSNISAIVDASIELLGGIIQAIPEITVEIIKAIPQIITGIAEGLLGGAGAIGEAAKQLFSGVDNSLDGLREKSKRLSNYVSVFSSVQPQLANIDTLLSTQGNTISQLDSSISETETAITTIIQTAINEQETARQTDLANIRAYQDELERLWGEKLDTYVQLQKRELTKLQLELGDLTAEEAAQALANAQEALSLVNEATEEAYNSRIAIVEDKLEHLKGYTYEQYKDDLAAAKEWHDGTLAENQQRYDDLIAMVGTESARWIEEESSKYDELIRIKDNYGRAVEQKYSGWGNDEKQFKADYIKVLESLNSESTIEFLNLVNSMKTNGKKLSNEQKTTAKNMLAAFDNLPAGLRDAGAESLQGMINGLETKIPGLEDTSEMSAKEIVDTLKSYLEVRSPSRVLKDIGENAGQGLVEGMDGKRSDVNTSAKSLADAIKQGLNQKLAEIKTASNNIVSGIKSAFDGISSSMYNIGTSIVEGIMRGISAQRNRLINQVSALMNDVTNTARNQMQIRSPSRVMADIGEQMAAGVGVGWTDMFDDVKGNIEDSLDFSAPDTAGGGFGASGGSMTVIVGLLQQILDNMGYDIVLDTGEIVGTIDRELGEYSYRAARGN